MSINCIALGKRISFYRLKFNITQEKLAALTNCSREYIAYLESGTKTPSLPTLIDLANVLHISVDDLLVDSLDYSFSTSGSDLHRLLLDCNQTEQEIIIRIRRLAFVPPYSVFCSISFRCGGLSIERNQKPLAPEITLAVTHHDRQKQVEVKRSSRVNPHEIRLFSGCPYAVVK